MSMQVVVGSIANGLDWQQIVFGMIITHASGRHREFDIHPLTAAKGALETYKSVLANDRSWPKINNPLFPTKVS